MSSIFKIQYCSDAVLIRKTEYQYSISHGVGSASNFLYPRAVIAGVIHVVVYGSIKRFHPSQFSLYRNDSFHDKAFENVILLALSQRKLIRRRFTAMMNWKIKTNI